MISGLIERAMRKSLMQHQEVHAKWITVQYKLSPLAGPPSLATFAANTRMDMLLRGIEAETLKRMGAPRDEVHLIDDFTVALSEMWVSRSYEIVRTARERAKRNDEVLPDRLQRVFELLELVRMPVDKGEIAKANRYKGEPIVLALQDGSDPREYDGTHLLPRGICGQTGAVMWWPVDLKTGTSLEVCRRDLSDMLLTSFD